MIAIKIMLLTGFALATTGIKSRHPRTSSKLEYGSHLMVLALATYVTWSFGSPLYSLHSDARFIHQEQVYVIAHEVHPLIPFRTDIVGINTNSENEFIKLNFTDQAKEQINTQYPYTPDNPFRQYLFYIIIGIWFPLSLLIFRDRFEKKLKSSDSIIGIRHKISTLPKSSDSEKALQTLVALRKKEDTLQKRIAEAFAMHMQITHLPQFKDWYPKDIANPNNEHTVLSWLGERMRNGAKDCSIKISTVNLARYPEYLKFVDTDAIPHLYSKLSATEIHASLDRDNREALSSNNILIERRSIYEQNSAMADKTKKMIQNRLNLLIPDNALELVSLAKDCRIGINLARLPSWAYSDSNDDLATHNGYSYSIKRKKKEDSRLVIHDRYFVIIKCLFKKQVEREFFYELDSVPPAQVLNQLMTKELKRRGSKSPDFDNKLVESATDIAATMSLLEQCFVPPAIKPCLQRPKKRLTNSAVQYWIRESYNELTDAVKGEIQTELNSSTFEALLSKNPELILNFLKSNNDLLMSAGLADGLSNEILTLFLSEFFNDGVINAICEGAKND
ncbi:hypothetical protein L1D22_00740 [Vibrio sp. Isolate34]|uniref:hypothetical protein n=1 Tax=Vibrio sp. Isolate34 TaxID=2908540 RepID=UPI001EFE8EB0|nr:hypothetical protein [Vibrio sp. Isolate34]MCG9638479.1 hypothetical protein [Vibrio sp. Isolate34]